jgi:hypothetical protein
MKQYVTVALFLHMLVEGTQTNVWLMNWNHWVYTWKKNAK